MTAASDATPHMHRRSWGLAALLASVSMLGPFAVDMYLPAFPEIGAEFGVAPLALQQTLSVYMIAYAFMMLWHGALSDSLGRRPIVLAGLVIFGLGTLGCAIAGNVQSLWLSRILQGLSAGTGSRLPEGGSGFLATGSGTGVPTIGDPAAGTCYGLSGVAADVARRGRGTSVAAPVVRGRGAVPGR